MRPLPVKDTYRKPCPMISGCKQVLPRIPAFFIIALTCLPAVAAFCEVLHVPGHYQGIQDALQAASRGDTVLVGPGTYRLFFDNLLISNEDIILRSSAGPEKTVIQGRGSKPVITVAQRSRAVIDGFTITRETESDRIPAQGGAIYCSAGSSPVITNNIILNNRAVFGAGIFCNTQSTPEIRNNLFFGNVADTSGGAIFTEHSRALIAGNSFQYNRAGNSGGALACNRDSSRIYSNIFWHNRADYGGAISCDRAAGWIYNNTIVSNSALKGAGIMVDRGSVRLLNLIFYDNSRGDLFSKGTGPAGRPQFSDMQEHEFAGVNGNISADPMFVDQQAGDFHLRPGSPCINTGDDDPFYENRDGSFNHMGAYGGPEPFAGTPLLSEEKTRKQVE